MPLRRLWAGIPLALLVAILAHVAGFGTTHLPGSGHAGGLAVALALALVTAFAAAFARALRTPYRLRAAGGSGADSARAALTLAAFAAGAFAAIELGEGHGVLAGDIVPLLALLPLAFLVAILARRAESLANGAGCRVAIYLRRRPTRARIARIALAVRADTRACVRTDVARRTLRGRAPPRFA